MQTFFNTCGLAAVGLMTAYLIQGVTQLVIEQITLYREEAGEKPENEKPLFAFRLAGRKGTR